MVVSLVLDISLTHERTLIGAILVIEPFPEFILDHCEQIKICLRWIHPITVSYRLSTVYPGWSFVNTEPQVIISTITCNSSVVCKKKLSSLFILYLISIDVFFFCHYIFPNKRPKVFPFFTKSYLKKEKTSIEIKV